MTDRIAHSDKENQTNKMVNELLTAELKRYEERIIIFEQSLNVDLNQIEKLIDSQMDDLNHDRNAKLAAFQQKIDTFKETLSNNFKEKESLLQTLSVFKIDSKEKESNYIDKEIVLEKQNKKLENIICKMYLSTVIAKEHAMIYVFDDEEILILEEESRSKTLDKQNDPISVEKKIKISPIYYSKLNNIKEDFGKHLSLNKNMFKLDIEPISPRLKNNEDAHEVYIKWTIEYADTLLGFVERARTQYPSEPLLGFASMFTKHLQELTKDSNKPLLTSTRVKPTTSAIGSKPLGNTKNNRITRTPRSNQKNKVEDHHRIVKSCLNKTNSISEPISNAHVKHSETQTNKSVGLSKKAKIGESKIANNSEPTHLWESNATDIPSSFSLVNDRLSRSSSGTVRFGNDQVAKIMGYGDYQQGNVIISRVYYVEGLRHNLFLVGQFCDADLKVAFWKKTCFIRNLEGVDLLIGSRDTNLYTNSLDDMLNTSLICLLSKASKTKSLLWHRRLSHLNFSTLNKLAKDGPKLQVMTPATSSSGFIPNITPQQPCNPPKRDDWDTLFQPLFDAYFNPPSIVVFTVPVVDAPSAVEIENLPMFTSISQDAPSLSEVDPTLFIRKARNDLLLEKPIEKHLNKVKQIFRYLKGTINMGLRSNRRRVPNIIEPEIRTIEEVVLMADRTMEELLQAPTKGYGEAIVIPEILAENFEIKMNLLQLVQAKKFHGFERDNPHTHISKFKRMTATLKYRDVPNDAIKLMLFSYSLEGAARIWYEKEPPNSILTWDDLVNKFVN
nr:retrovirus-related Pol polyprotein from transposon TNT 1-94 [Tanacetum cinerariifolium]